MVMNKKIRMFRSVIIAALVPMVMLSCKHSKRDLIIGAWHAVKLDNPEMDSFFINSQAFIDTVGKGTDAAANMQLYGVANMDSMRKVLQGQYDSAKAIQMQAVTNTVFNFRKDSIVVLSFNGATDSSKWYFDESGALVLDELATNQQAGKVKMDVLELTDATLKLKFEENNATSTVTFKREGK
jgi:hypothetical protein